MASLSSQRFANRIGCSLHFATRSRTFVSCVFGAENERPQRRRAGHHPSHNSSRLFSCCHSLQQGTIQPKTPSPAEKTSATPFPARQPPPSTTRTEAATPPQDPIRELTKGLLDEPLAPEVGSRQVDWTRSFHGLSTEAFSPEARAVLQEPLDVEDIEVKPEGLIYLPEIKYRRILNRAFGPGAWGLAPRGETIVTAKAVTREYALLIHGRLISLARGEQDYFDPSGIPTATEGCKSNALMRCCKDLGIASELWDPRYIRKFMKQHVKELWVEHAVTKKRKKISIRKDDEVRYPFKEVKGGAGGAG